MKRMLHRLPPMVRDAVKGLAYALILSLIILLWFAPESAFRYLTL